MLLHESLAVCAAGSKAAPELTWAFLHWSLHPENQLQVASHFSLQQWRPFSSCKGNVINHMLTLMTTLANNKATHHNNYGYERLPRAQCHFVKLLSER